MTYDDYELGEYDDYTLDFDPFQHDRKARRKRKPKPVHQPKKSQEAILEEIADTVGLEAGFETTYTPAKHEAVWLYESLRPFYDQALITDVMAIVKGGKEASVYRCLAHESTGKEWIAAKVYRPRMFRNLRNDKMYKEGRGVLKFDGTKMKDNDHRTRRALKNKTKFGEEISHVSWLMFEYQTLQTLYALDADVPEPIITGNNAILMSYHGDPQFPAPTLNSIDLDPTEAEELFQKVMWNVELMLEQNTIHGDLSAYNILYWEGDITLIDFPQVTSIDSNPKADFILRRDIQRVCDYFGGQGVVCDAQAIFTDFWNRFGTAKPLPPEEPYED